MAQERCKLMGGTFENFVQFLLFVIVMSVLWFKRWRERPRRSYKIWFMDIFKQICSGTEAHLINLGVSTLLGDASSTSNKVDDCEWYFVNFSLDTTVGLMLTFFSLKGVERMARRRDWTSLKVSGEYGTPPSYRVWAKQLACWLSIICLVKSVVVVLIIVLNEPLGLFGVAVLGWLEGDPNEELLVVMIACPCFMNLLQYWVQDSFLKKQEGHPVLRLDDWVDGGGVVGDKYDGGGDFHALDGGEDDEGVGGVGVGGTDGGQGDHKYLLETPRREGLNNERQN